jgi:hypothetical protein
MSAVEAKALTALSSRLHASFHGIDRKAILGFALKFIRAWRKQKPRLPFT